MGSLYCVGGVDIESNKSVRLLQDNGYAQPITTPFSVGQLWEINYTTRINPVPPHTEDVLITGAPTLLTESVDVKSVISQHFPSSGIWNGDPSCIFSGRTSRTINGAAYISQPNLPLNSTGFWTPTSDLIYNQGYYETTIELYGFLTTFYKFKYVGAATPPLKFIPSGTLVRLSLARWWKPDNNPDFELRCYVQLSGWH